MTEEVYQNIDMKGNCLHNITLCPVTRVITDAGAVTITGADYIVIVNKTVGEATTANLSAGTENRTFVIKDGKGDAGTNNITITPAGSETIDGAATVVINTNYGVNTVIWNGTQWNVI